MNYIGKEMRRVDGYAKVTGKARYAAESGLHSAANYLIHVYEPPGADAGDPLVGVYDTTKSPVRLMANDEPVVLTTVDGETSNYPIDAKIEAFKDDSQGELLMSNSRTTYTATATLLSMRRFPDAYSGADVTISNQTSLAKLRYTLELLNPKTMLAE